MIGINSTTTTDALQAQAKIDLTNNILEESSQYLKGSQIMELFQQCKPYLDKGMGFYKACRIVRNIPSTSCFGNRSWYKRFRDYAIAQGYKPLR